VLQNERHHFLLFGFGFVMANSAKRQLGDLDRCSKGYFDIRLLRCLRSIPNSCRALPSQERGGQHLKAELPLHEAPLVSQKLSRSSAFCKREHAGPNIQQHSKQHLANEPFRRRVNRAFAAVIPRWLHVRHILREILE
jgi:hypothetical protein